MNVTIPDLPETDSVSDSDIMIIQQNGTTFGGLLSVLKVWILAFVNPVINAVQRTGTALAFNVNQAFYGTISQPETGDITSVVLNPILGSTILLIHNDVSQPNFDASFQKLSGSGGYVTDQINYISFTFIDSTHIIYTISQSK